MTIFDLLAHVGFFLLLLWISTGTGLFILSQFQARLKEETEVGFFELGSAGLLGLGIIGLIGLLASLVGIFTYWILLIAGLILLLTTSIPLWHAVKKLNQLPKSYNPFIMIGLVICLALLGTLFLRALNPPWIADELGYHMPHVEMIIKAHKIPLNFDGHYFYGNIPKLMEVIFAIGVTLSGFALAHLLHLAFLVCFCCLIFGLIQKRYSTSTALLTLLFILTYDDLVTNAVIGYIDAATVLLEIASLLLVVEWITSKRMSLLIIAGCLIGFSISMKYSSLPTIAFLFLVIIFTLWRDTTKTLNQKMSLISYFLVPPIVIASYWYGKNLIQFHNPTYPLYFGHPGVDDIHFNGLINAIQQFGPRTPSVFLTLPLRFLSLGSLTLFFTFFLTPLSLLIKKARSFHALLVVYFCLYCPYWFFIATHQARFLMPGLIVGLILSAIFLSQLSPKTRGTAWCSVLVITLIMNQSNHFLISFRHLKTVVGTKFQIGETDYGLGKISQTDYLSQRLGCQYAIIEALKKRGLSGTVIDNWSVWFDPSAAFYADHNPFSSLDFDTHASHEDVYQFLVKKDIHFLYINTHTKAAHFASQDPEIIAHRIGPGAAEAYLLPYTHVIETYAPCQLYAIDLEKLRQDT